MPEMTFEARWPDGRVDAFYSPSLVVHDHLDEDTAYPVAEFVRRATAALAQAGDRVRARYGFSCSASAASAAQVRDAAAAYRPDDVVHVLRLHPPLPGGSHA